MRSPCDGSHSRTVREASGSLRTAYRRPKIFSRWNRLGRKSELRRSSHNGTRQKSAVRNRPIVGRPKDTARQKAPQHICRKRCGTPGLAVPKDSPGTAGGQPIIGQNPPGDKNRNRVKILNTHAVKTGQDMRNDPPQSDGASTARRRHARPTSASRAIVSPRVMGASDPPAGRSARKSNRDRASSRREPSSRITRNRSSNASCSR